MSCDWDVWCFDCKANLTNFSDANHREEYMLHVIKAAQAISALGKIDPTARITLANEFEQLSFKAYPFVEHHGHILQPRDEYGKWYMQCSKILSHEWPTKYCGLREHHDGEHDPKEWFPTPTMIQESGFRRKQQ